MREFYFIFFVVFLFISYFIYSDTYESFKRIKNKNSNTIIKWDVQKLFFTIVTLILLIFFIKSMVKVYNNPLCGPSLIFFYYPMILFFYNIFLYIVSFKKFIQRKSLKKDFQANYKSDENLKLMINFREFLAIVILFSLWCNIVFVGIIFKGGLGQD